MKELPTASQARFRLRYLSLRKVSALVGAWRLIIVFAKEITCVCWHLVMMAEFLS